MLEERSKTRRAFKKLLRICQRLRLAQEFTLAVCTTGHVGLLNEFCSISLAKTYNARNGSIAFLMISESISVKRHALITLPCQTVRSENLREAVKRDIATSVEKLQQCRQQLQLAIDRDEAQPHMHLFRIDYLICGKSSCQKMVLFMIIYIIDRLLFS